MHIVSWFTDNAGWEFFATLMLTLIARVVRLTLGKKMTVAHELLFWATCLLCGTLTLAVANNRIVRPLQNKMFNVQPTTPNFHCTISDFFVSQQITSVGDYHVLTENRCGVTLFLGVVNSGAPSVAWNWTLHAKLLSGEILTSTASSRPTYNTFGSAQGNPALKMEKNDWLPYVTLENPIPNGAGKIGNVSFFFDKSNFDELNRAGTVLTLTFDDCTGRTIETSITNSATKRLF